MDGIEMVSTITEIRECFRSKQNAIGALCTAFYKEYGDKIIPIISDTAQSHTPYHLPQVKALSGKGMKALGEYIGSFPVVEILTSTEDMVHFQTKGTCPYGLNDTSKELCEAIMIFDRKAFDTIVGKEVRMEIIQSLASGDGYCEVKISSS